MGMFTEWRDDAYAALQAKYAKLEADYKRLLEGDDWVARCIRLENLHKDLVDEHRVTEEQLAEALAENAALVAEFQRLADEPPTLEEIAADLDKIEILEKQLAEAQTEVERLALEIENRQYTITCASEENQQLKESLAEARAEIERQTDRIMSDACIISAAALAIAERDKLIEQLKKALESAKQKHYVNDDDNWYSCPASGLCSNDHAGTDCNCGADHVNSIIQAALRAADGGKP